MTKPPVCEPTHRAVFSGRRLTVVPWQQLNLELAPQASEDWPVFDLWAAAGSPVVARQHGTWEASAEIRRLGRWAREEAGAELELATPRL